MCTQRWKGLSSRLLDMMLSQPGFQQRNFSQTPQDHEFSGAPFNSPETPSFANPVADFEPGGKVGSNQSLQLPIENPFSLHFLF